MSYNVDRFTIKEMRDFTLPFGAIIVWTDGYMRVTKGGYEFDHFDVEGMFIAGTFNDKPFDRLTVSTLNYYGTYSGSFWDTFKEVLQQSTGYLHARVVWESGDTIQMLTVKDGTVWTEDV